MLPTTGHPAGKKSSHFHFWEIFLYQEELNAYREQGFAKGEELCLFCELVGWLEKCSFHDVWLTALL